MNKKTKIILSGLLALIALCGPAYLYLQPPAPKTWKDVLPKPEHTKVDERKPLHEQTRVLEIAGRTFEIPIMYFDTALDSGLKQDGLLLEVIWPEMRSPYELKDKAEYTRIWKQEHRLGWILLEPASKRPPLDVQVGNMQRSMMKWETAGTSGGVEKQLWYRGTPEQPKLQHEVLLERDQSGVVVNYVDCDSAERGPFPTCSHKFIDGGLIYKVSYNRAAFFDQWREQQKRAVEFMNKYEIDNSGENQ